MPLGDKLWEETSKAVGRRILEVSDQGVHEEVSFVGEIKGFGRLNGARGRIVGTDDYVEKLTEDIISGTAAGVLRMEDGEIIPFKTVGVGKLVRKSPLGIEKLLSLLSFINPPPNYAWMRSTIVVWEAETD